MLTLVWFLDADAAPAKKTDPVRISDAVDADYYAASGRADAAAEWYHAKMTAEPTRAEWAIGWLDTLGRLPNERARLPGSVPNLGPAVAARVIALRGMDPTAVSDDAFPDRPGRWCEEVLALLEKSDDLETRVRAKGACGVDAAQDRAKLAESSLERFLAPFDPAGLRRALDAEPWRVAELAAHAAPDEPNPAVRVFVLDRARATAIEQKPALVAASIVVLAASGEYFEEMEARRLLYGRDDGNAENAREMRRPRPPRLAATKWIPPSVPEPPAMPPPAKSKDEARQAALVAKLHEAVAFEDHDAVFEVRGELWRIHRDVPTALAFADAANRAEPTPASRAALASALETLQSDRKPDPALLGRALELKAKLHVHDGESDLAIASYREAVRVDGPNYLRLHQIGTLSHMSGRWADAVPAYAALIAHPKTPTHTQWFQRFWLARSIERSGRTFEGGVDALIAAYAPGGPPSELVSHPEYVAAVPPPEDLPPIETAPLPDLKDAPWDIPVTLDGERTALGEIDGPVVVDVWATWCGPCTSTMHQFESFAAARSGEATFVLLSVDDDPADAQRFLAKHGHGEHVAVGFGGPEAMELLDIHGIPAYLVLDREAGVFAKVRGPWHPDQLDEALRRVAER